MKKYLWTLAGLLVVVALGSAYKIYVVDARTQAQAIAEDYRNGTYRIGGDDIRLTDGVSMKQGSMGASDILITRYFGNEVRGDFDGDGKMDAAFLMTQNNGGSGVFYIVVVALASEGSIHTTQPYLLGDRIAPQTSEFRDGILTINYATRKAGEPFTTPPSVATSVFLQVRDGKLVKAQ